MSITYLCGGINGLSDDECKNWREVAKTELKTDKLDPMRNDWRGQEDEKFQSIVAADQQDIRDCDFVLVNATRPSWGTAMEIVYAFILHKPIVAFTEGARVSPWLRFHCREIFPSAEEAAAYINSLAA